VDETTVRVLSMVILLLTLVVVAVPSRRRTWLRRIPAYDMMTSLTGLAIEANRPLHVSLGSAGIGGTQTLLALASAELAYYFSMHAAVGDVSPLITVSDTSALPIAQDALRRAHAAQGLAGSYRATAAHWYPAGTRSIAFAAAITGLMAAESVSSNVMAGSYGPELALVLNASRRRGLNSIAVSDHLEGQAVAYAMADYPLIGEEVFVAPSYLDDDPTTSHRAVAIDVLRWLLIIAMIVGFGLQVAEGA